MFSTTNLFKAVACPEGERCQLLNCMFSHELQPQQISNKTACLQDGVSAKSPSSQQQDQQHEEPPLKRRKITYDRLEDKPLSRAEQIRAQLAKDRTTSKPLDSQAASTSRDAMIAADRPLASLARAVSPPRSTANSGSALKRPDEGKEATDIKKASSWLQFKQRSSDVAETLNPRLMKPAPESHAKRVVYVQHIYKHIVRLNQELKADTAAVEGLEVAAAQEFVLSNQEMISFALDEEEIIARTKPKIYANAIRNYVAAYQKMTLSSWLSKLKLMAQFDLPGGAAFGTVAEHSSTISTGLPIEQEYLLLPHLVVKDQSSLKQYGYIDIPPSEHDIDEARKAVDFSRNYEECDRCGRRFRVFPDRDAETGRLTSNGPCKYHWARKSFPAKQKTDNYTGSNEAMYPCCGQGLGTEACTEHEEHVFKCSAPNRLAAVMPFVSTPENASPRNIDGKAVKAVVFDCEMGYTTNGMELIRLTALSWPDGKSIVDVLVRPLGAVIDLNTRFSGVKPEDLANAVPYIEGSTMGLSIVESPAMARKLLCQFLTPDTPLIGHAIDNDLNATRLCHPTIIDTVLLYSHPRGLPFRYGLKMLSKKYLKRNIQTGGSTGHDSHEDAMATGDLVKVKMVDLWKELKEGGWEVKDGQLVRPTNQQAVIGWAIPASKAAKARPAAQNNGLAKILAEARSTSVQGASNLTTDLPEP